MLLMCFIVKKQLLCMQCKAIGPHLVARGMSHGFSRVAAGTWGIFSSYDGMPILNGSLFVKSGHLSRYDIHRGKLN